MSDMLGKPHGGWTCVCCWDGSKFQGQNRKHEERQWQRDQVAGEYSPHQLSWDDDEAHEHGGISHYMALPEHKREPWWEYLIPHGPKTVEQWQRQQRFKKRLQQIREELRQE